MKSPADFAHDMDGLAKEIRKAKNRIAFWTQVLRNIEHRVEQLKKEQEEPR